MAKLTKAQKKRLCQAIHNKSVKLFANGEMSMNDCNKIIGICQKIVVKLGYKKSDL